MSNRRKIERPPGLLDDEDDLDRTTAVSAAYTHLDEVDYNFFHSYFQLLAYDLAHDGNVWRGGPVAMYGGTDGLAHSRNTAVRDFLAADRADWLWWIDTDMGFAPDTVARLLADADPVERPVVGGLCFAALHEDEDGAGGWRDVYMPVVMDWTHTDTSTGFAVRWDYPRNALTRCDGTGSACVLIHRSVFERIREPHGPDWKSWYSRVINPATGELVSEDLSFCLRLMQAGIPLYVDTSVLTTHAKRLWLSQEDYWRQRALNPPVGVAEAVESGRQPERVERLVPRYAIIPTHNRPQLLLTLVATLGQQADTVVVVDNASTPPVDVDRLRAAVPPTVAVEVIRDEEQPPNLSRLWNVMFDRCAELAKDAGHDEYDVAVFNDDSVVPAGWYDVVSAGLRGHETAAVAHTGTVPVSRLELRTRIELPRQARMCPWAFVTRGELGLRADESMRWWYFDDDFDRTARISGGVLQVPGPLVVNSLANSTTGAALAEQAAKDQATFAAKWAGR